MRNDLDEDIWVNVNDVLGPVPARTVTDEFFVIASPNGAHDGADAIIAMGPPDRGLEDCFDTVVGQVIRSGGSYLIRVTRGVPPTCRNGFPQPSAKVSSR